MRLREFRKNKKLTQAQVAKQLNITANAYGHYETERNQPDIKTLIKMADIFHTTIDALLEHEVPYLLDKSLLSDEQNKVIEKVITLNNDQCAKVDAYIDGLKD